MILTVSGWRAWTDPTCVLACLLRYHHHYGSQLIWRVGCADGVDKLVREFLVDHRVPDTHFCIYRANWAQFGKPAGPIRNGQMLQGDNYRDPFPGVRTDRLLAFPQPGINWKTDKSGTVDCILQAVKLGVHLEIPGY